MLLHRGLPRKINPRLTSSASCRISSPHHLTQCSPHKHEHRSWVAMQEGGTLFGILSEGKTKAMRKKSKTLNFSTLTGLLHLFTFILLSFIYIPSDYNKTDLGVFFFANCSLATIRHKIRLLCFCPILSKVLPGEANSIWNWLVLNDTSVCRRSGIAHHPPATSPTPSWLSCSPSLNLSLHVWWPL